MEDIKFTTAENYMKDQAYGDILQYLTEGIAKIVFRKKDGTERVMLATLQSDKIPADMMPKNEETRTRNPDVQAVFDIESNGWRSFRWDSVTQYGKHYVD